MDKDQLTDLVTKSYYTAITKVSGAFDESGFKVDPNNFSPIDTFQEDEAQKYLISVQNFYNNPKMQEGCFSDIMHHYKSGTVKLLEMMKKDYQNDMALVAKKKALTGVFTLATAGSLFAYSFDPALGYGALFFGSVALGLYFRDRKRIVTAKKNYSRRVNVESVKLDLEELTFEQFKEVMEENKGKMTED